MRHEEMIAIWKPKGPTSHDIVDAVRRVTGERRVGHAGTLDPMAEGILVVGIGRAATKQLDDVVQKEKEYVATIRLGATSTTDDAEGEVREIRSSELGARGETPVAKDALEAVLTRFIGRIDQIPPTYSAVKIRGRPAHRRARRGEPVTLRPRTVEIRAIELLRYEWPELDLRVVTGPGVYIRALARDVGHALGVGGYLAALTRTRVGDFTKARALTLAAFATRYRTALPENSNPATLGGSLV